LSRFNASTTTDLQVPSNVDLVASLSPIESVKQMNELADVMKEEMEKESAQNPAKKRRNWGPR
jgi:hypothetical protein